jgi:hypothetical protein
MRTICAWCKNTMAEHNIQLEDISHGMCKECMREIYKQMNEWKFEPETGGLNTHRKPIKTLTQLKSPKDDSEMDDYEETEDASTNKTQDVIEKYRRKNQKLSGVGKPFSSATNSLGT